MSARPLHRGDADEVKRLLQVRLDSLLSTLLPDGRRAGGYWLAPAPTRTDRKLGVFWVSLNKNPGYWKDESQGLTGDVFELIRVCRGGEFRDAIAWARDWLGLDQLTSLERQAQARRADAIARQRTGDHDASHAEMLARHRRQAQARWLKSSPTLAGTPVATYFAVRGIDLARLPRVSGAMRYDADGVHRESGGEIFPCLRVMMTMPDGSFGALHSTYLAHDGRGKAAVTPQRKIWPSFAGAAMRLARGKTGLDVVTAVERGIKEPLVLCEGVEDALSIALLYPDLRVWAVASLGNFAHQALPACCNEVIVAADNDWGKPQARAMFDRAVATLSRGGEMPVIVMRSPVGKDFNDALMAQGRTHDNDIR